jgi:hypothetical protein
VQVYVKEPVSATVLAGHGLGYLCKGKIESHRVEIILKGEKVQRAMGK